MQRVARGSLVAVGILLILVGWAWYHREWQTYHGYHPLPFSSDAWGRADAESRGRMLDDLLRKHPLEGKSAGEVKELLGEPDAGVPTQLHYKVGHRGYNPRALFVFPYTLFIDVNEEGHVERVFTGD